jgi:hypothetical protein
MAEFACLPPKGESVKSNDGVKRKKKRKPYERPTATQLSPDEAKAKLLRLADQGDQQAKEMLRTMFPDESQETRDNSKDQKKSA